MPNKQPRLHSNRVGPYNSCGNRSLEFKFQEIIFGKRAVSQLYIFGFDSTESLNSKIHVEKFVKKTVWRELDYLSKSKNTMVAKVSRKRDTTANSLFS